MGQEIRSQEESGSQTFPMVQEAVANFLKLLLGDSVQERIGYDIRGILSLDEPPGIQRSVSKVETCD
jgi:hypothetical protein